MNRRLERGESRYVGIPWKYLVDRNGREASRDDVGVYEVACGVDVHASGILLSCFDDGGYLFQFVSVPTHRDGVGFLVNVESMDHPESILPILLTTVRGQYPARKIKN